MLNRDDLSELMPQFCAAPRDPALATDDRVLAGMLSLEPHYAADLEASYGRGPGATQDEITLRMRQIVAEWMLEVCADQRCHPDVFLLASNIIDRFLAAIRYVIA